MSHPFDPSPPAGFVLGGLHGSSGKTVVTCLLAAGFAARGLAVQPLKAGPDFIDPGYHNQFNTRPSRNLDAWLMGKDRVLLEAMENTRNATGILEGVMGLFDGASPTSEEGSTMELARWLDWPVILCIPAAKAGRSLAATLRGFLAEAAPTKIAGVVLNGVSGDSHTEYLREAIRPLGIHVLGAIPKTDLLNWPERHLGLRAPQEFELPSQSDLAQFAERTLDIASFMALSRVHRLQPRPPLATTKTATTRKIAVAQDEAFHFYYHANLEWLEKRGAELLPFSPLRAHALPSGCDAVVLGGGFPEIYAGALADNAALRKDLRDALSAGLPCYAECGGLMLLAHELETLDGARYPMAGVLPGNVSMTRSLQHFGYCSAGENHPGHEFHHSQWNAEATHSNAWKVSRRRSGTSRREGFRTPTLHASYVHLYFPQSASFLNQQLGFTP